MFEWDIYSYQGSYGLNRLFQEINGSQYHDAMLSYICKPKNPRSTVSELILALCADGNIGFVVITKPGVGNKILEEFANMDLQVTYKVFYRWPLSTHLRGQFAVGVSGVWAEFSYISEFLNTIAAACATPFCEKMHHHINSLGRFIHKFSKYSQFKKQQLLGEISLSPRWAHLTFKNYEGHLPYSNLDPDISYVHKIYNDCKIVPPLHKALIRNDVLAVEQILQKDFTSINSRCPWGLDAKFLAVRLTSPEMFNVLKKYMPLDNMQTPEQTLQWRIAFHQLYKKAIPETPELIHLIAKNDIKNANKYIKEYPESVNQANHLGFTPLLVALDNANKNIKKYIRLIKLLLQKGATLDDIYSPEIICNDLLISRKEKYHIFDYIHAINNPYKIKIIELLLHFRTIQAGLYDYQLHDDSQDNLYLKLVLSYGVKPDSYYDRIYPYPTLIGEIFACKAILEGEKNFFTQVGRFSQRRHMDDYGMWRITNQEELTQSITRIDDAFFLILDHMGFYPEEGFDPELIPEHYQKAIILHNKKLWRNLHPQLKIVGEPQLKDNNRVVETILQSSKFTLIASLKSSKDIDEGNELPKIEAIFESEYDLPKDNTPEKKKEKIASIKEKNFFIELYKNAKDNEIIGFSFFTLSNYPSVPNLVEFIVGLIQIVSDFRSCGLATFFYRIPLAMAMSYRQLFFVIGTESAQPGWSYCVLPPLLDFFPKYNYPGKLIKDMMKKTGEIVTEHHKIKTSLISKSNEKPRGSKIEEYQKLTGGPEHGVALGIALAQSNGKIIQRDVKQKTGITHKDSTKLGETLLCFFAHQATEVQQILSPHKIEEVITADAWLSGKM